MSFCEFLQVNNARGVAIGKQLIVDFSDVLEVDDQFALERYIVSYLIAHKGKYEKVTGESEVSQIYADLLLSNHVGHTLKDLASHNRRIRYYYRKIQRLLNRTKIINIPKNLTLAFVQEKKQINYLLRTNLRLDNMIFCMIGDCEECYRILTTISPFVIRLPVKLAPPNIPKFLLNFFETKIGITTVVQDLSPKNLLCFEGSPYYCSLLSVVGKKNQIPTFCIQWGIHYPIWSDVAFSNMEFDYFISWGKHFSKELKKTNPKLKFKEYCHFRANDGKKVRNAVIFLDQVHGELISKKDRKALVDMAVKLKKHRPNCHVIYRVHPQNKDNFLYLDYLLKNGVKVGDLSKSLSDELEDCWAAVAIYSSGLVEAVGMGVIPLSVNTTCHEKFPIFLGENKIGFEVDSFVEGNQKLFELCDNLPVQSKYRKNIERFRGKLFSDNSDLESILNC